ncbi:Neuronal acetylcholine receptor subunit [Sparganum proliferum]
MVLSSNGDVLWIPPAIFKSSCQIDVRYFPFDQQTCQIKLGSWTYNRKQVDLQFYSNRTSLDLSNYVTSGGWDIVDCPANLDEQPVPNEERQEGEMEFGGKVRYGTISIRPRGRQMTFHIVLRRKPLFYTTNMIIPCVLIALLSTCVFYLPTDAGEKITLSISILVTLVVFMLLVSKMLPPGPKTIPLLSQFLLFTFAMNFLTLFITVVIINLNHRNPKTHSIPAWMRTVFIHLMPPFLGLERPKWRPNALNGVDQVLMPEVDEFEEDESPKLTGRFGDESGPTEEDFLSGRQTEGVDHSAFLRNTQCGTRGTRAYVFSREVHSSKDKVRGDFCQKEQRESTGTTQYDKELAYLYRLFRSNGYPTSFVKNCLRHQAQPQGPTLNGEIVSRQFFSLPYMQGTSEVIARQLNRSGIHIAHKPASSLRAALSRIKDPLPKEQQTNVIYRIPCSNCSCVYVGHTGRSLGTRIKEHKLAVRRRDPLSLVFAHALECDHRFNWDGTEVVAMANTKRAREFLEAWYSNAGSINRHVDLDAHYEGLRSRLTAPCPNHASTTANTEARSPTDSPPTLPLQHSVP